MDPARLCRRHTGVKKSAESCRYSWNPSKNKLNQTDNINTIGDRNKTDKTANTESIEYSGKVHHKEKYKNTGILQNTGKFLEYWSISKY